MEQRLLKSTFAIEETAEKMIRYSQSAKAMLSSNQCTNEQNEEVFLTLTRIFWSFSSWYLPIKMLSLFAAIKALKDYTTECPIEDRSSSAFSRTATGGKSSLTKAESKSTLERIESKKRRPLSTTSTALGSTARKQRRTLHTAKRCFSVWLRATFQMTSILNHQSLHLKSNPYHLLNLKYVKIFEFHFQLKFTFTLIFTFKQYFVMY